MGYLSPQIATLAKKRKREDRSLVKKENSCGIFQDYGELEEQADTTKGELDQ
ncbi:MAG: hypothetical protein AAFX53_16260 [Bacteroidota bacterium]